MNIKPRYQNIIYIIVSLFVINTCYGDKGVFANFIGVNHGNYDGNEIWDFIGFTRSDLEWGRLQPHGPKEWNQKYLDAWGNRVLKNHKHNISTLPVLSYLTIWAARRSAWNFTWAGKHYDIPARKPEDKINVIVTDIKTGKKSSRRFSWRVPPENVADWEYFVERVVKYLTEEPYNVKYFQIWNEADDRFTGFWYGGMDEYMKTIHIPAAKIIHKYGAKVVYGGYPCSGNIKHFLSVIDRHKAWDTIDVIDIHYFPLSAWEQLDQAMKSRGLKKALWQTEIGFVKRHDWIPNTYPRFFYWAITHGFSKDKYKIFQYPYSSPGDPRAHGYNKGFLIGKSLTSHGKALVTLGSLLKGPWIEPYNNWQTVPVLKTEIDEQKSSVEGFLCNSRIVLSFHMRDQNGAAIFVDWNGKKNSLHLDWPTSKISVYLNNLKKDHVKKAWRIGIFGSKIPLNVISQKQMDGIRIDIPTKDPDGKERYANRSSRMHSFYLLIEKK